MKLPQIIFAIILITDAIIGAEECCNPRGDTANGEGMLMTNAIMFALLWWGGFWT